MNGSGPPLVIASQLGETCDALISAALGDRIRLHPIARGPVSDLPPDATVLFASPFVRAGRSHAPRPPGWPFGVKWVQLLSAGTDAYPDWLFDGPTVCTARGMLAVPISEFCLALILAAAKDLPTSWIDDPRDWRLLRLRSLEGSVLGIYGFGAIGEALARRALPFGMEVIAVRRSAAPLPPGIGRADDMAELMRRSDHLVLAAPATAETRHVVNAQTLAHARPGLHLVNVARGSLVDTTALLDALDQGRLARASLDVAEHEPPEAGHWLYTHPRVRLSPHTSAVTSDFDERAARFFVDNCRRYLAGETPLNIVTA